MELVKNSLFARYFERSGARFKERSGREVRRELLAGLSGWVLEVGAGTGLNFPHYPVSVRDVVAVDPEPVPARPRHAGCRGRSGAGQGS
jgi:hypothetical protein